MQLKLVEHAPPPLCLPDSLHIYFHKVFILESLGVPGSMLQNKEKHKKEIQSVLLLERGLVIKPFGLRQKGSHLIELRSNPQIPLLRISVVSPSPAKSEMIILRAFK